jgi:hypothetical protein
MIADYLARHPSVYPENETSDNWEFLIRVHEDALATIADHPVSFSFSLLDFSTH